MKTEKTNLLVCIFVLFIAICIITTSAIIYSTPVEITSGTAGNYTGNIANGGYVLEDDGFLFYASPNGGGIIRTETNKTTESQKIIDEDASYLQTVGSGYYYLHNDTLKRCNVDGEKQQTVVKFAKKPLVVGATVFYLDKQNNLMKYSMQSGKTITVLSSNSATVKEFAVYYKKVYYTDNNGNIRKVSFDGSDDVLFMKANASKLSVDGQYLFYIENGTVCSAMISENQIVTSKIVAANQYVVFGEYILYSCENKLYHANINDLVKDKQKAKITTIYEEKCSGLSIDNDYFYFFNNKGEFFRINHDSKKLKQI